MLKDYEIDKSILETDRLIIRKVNENDVPDLKEWLGKTAGTLKGRTRKDP